MCVYIYMYTCIYYFLREYSSMGHGLRFSTDISGSKQEDTVFHEHLQDACFVTEIFESLRKPPGVHGIM